jgi:hypothetical protein
MNDIDAWWLALTVFAAAIVVVAVLLGLILATLKTIDYRADGIWMEGKQTTGNTAAIWMLQQTNEHLARMSRDARALAHAAEAIDAGLKPPADAAGRGD